MHHPKTAAEAIAATLASPKPLYKITFRIFTIAIQYYEKQSPRRHEGHEEKTE